MLAGTAARCIRLMAKRVALDRKRMVIRSADGTARSVRAIIVYMGPYNIPNTAFFAV